MAAPALPYAVEDFADKLHIRSAPFVPMRQEEISGLGTGEGLTADLGPMLYRAVVETAPQPNADAEALMALIEALGGSRECFYLYDPMHAYPAADPDGSLLDDASPSISAISTDRRSISLTGLPANYVLTVGDWLAIDYGTPSRRALMKVLEGVVSGSTGVTTSFALASPLRPGVTVGLDVMLRKPAAKMKMLPDTLSLVPVDLMNASVRFTAQQTLAAG